MIKEISIKFFNKVYLYMNNSAIYLLLLVTSMLVIPSLAFLINIDISKMMLPIIIIITSILFILVNRKNWKNQVITIAIALVIFTIFTSIIGKCYDSTADGNTYHKLAVGAMKNGWNPVYGSVGEFGIKDGNVFDVSPDNVNQKWVDTYPKGSEIFGAVMYAFTNNIETGKVYNILFIYIGIFVISSILQKMNINKVNSLIIAGILSFNPIILVQLNNYYLDGVLAITLFTTILGCMVQNQKLSKQEIKENYFIIGAMIIWGISVKFTGIGYMAVFCFIFYLYNHIRNYKTEKFEYFKKALIMDTIFYILIVIIALVVVGSSSYLKNFVQHGHPLYPLYGEGKVESMVKKEMPISLHDNNQLEIFLTSIFSKSENCMASYAGNQNQPKLKIPFTFDLEEVESFQIPDIRIGGFGILFGGITIISIALTLYMMIRIIRFKGYQEIIKYMILNVVSIVLILFLEGNYWARYIPYFYLVATYPLIYFMKKDVEVKKYMKYVTYFFAIICIINVIPIAYIQVKSTITNKEYIEIRKERFLNHIESNINKDEKIQIKLNHTGLQAIQYNLVDWYIDNIETVEKLESQNDVYMFVY